MSCSWPICCFIHQSTLCNAIFLLKILQTNTKKQNSKSYQPLGSLMSHTPFKTFWSWFSLLHQLYQAEILLRCCLWRCPPCSDDMEVRKLVTIFLSARLSSQGQFYSTNVLADDNEVWPWLWHMTCTLEQFFYLKKKKRCESLCTVTCQENDLLHRLRAGSPLLPLLPLPPLVHPGGFQ